MSVLHIVTRSKARSGTLQRQGADFTARGLLVTPKTEEELRLPKG